MKRYKDRGPARRRNPKEPERESRVPHSRASHEESPRGPNKELPPRPSLKADGGQRVSHRSETEAREAESGAGEASAQLYGVLPVLEVLRAASRPIERITLAEGVQESRLRELLELARAAHIPVRRVPRAELQRLSAGANHQGVIASVAAARYAETDALLDALSSRLGTAEPPLALVLDGVEDPRNLGAILRTAECAGAHGVFVPERRAVGLTETVAKAAAGALEYIPVARVGNVVRLLEELKERGVWTVGTAADAALGYTGWDWTQPSALLLGSEGEGLRRLVRERCDVLVSVPLRGHIESLNVSVAAGVVLYEALRQRTAARQGTYTKAKELNESSEG